MEMKKYGRYANIMRWDNLRNGQKREMQRYAREIILANFRHTNFFFFLSRM